MGRPQYTMRSSFAQIHMMERLKFENDISNKQQLKCLIGIINIIVMEIQFCI
jgi:hypothetical protein